MSSSSSDEFDELPPPPPTRRPLIPRERVINLITNHLTVGLKNKNNNSNDCFIFYRYGVQVFHEDGSAVYSIVDRRRMVDAVMASHFPSEVFDYDGDCNLFTVLPVPPAFLGPLLTIQKGKAVLNLISDIPIRAIMDATGHGDLVRVFNIILRNHAAKRGCLLVRQSFFHNNPEDFVDIGGGVLGCRGLHSSFRSTKGGLKLNIDVSTTLIFQPGPVIDFLLTNQNVCDLENIDWAKAKRTLKNLRIKNAYSNVEYKISGLSDQICKMQKFLFKQKVGECSIPNEEEITVYNYFVSKRGIPLKCSGDFPCINVGKPNHPVFIPIELCELVSLQRYTKSLSNFQRHALVEKSVLEPKKRMSLLKHALGNSNYGEVPLLKCAGISVSPKCTLIQGRVLRPPQLIVGKEKGLTPWNGRWNFNDKEFFKPIELKDWAVVNFSSYRKSKICNLIEDLCKCGKVKGVCVHPPIKIIDEMPGLRQNPAHVRVKDMAKMVTQELGDTPQFLLCILPEPKNSDIYGPWKKMTLCDLGIVSQCIAAPKKLNDQYLSNLLLKINAKLGGLNFELTLESSLSMPLLLNVPTLIVGMDVCHGSPGRSDIPSIAAVVSSRQWPSISHYRAAVCTQSPKQEMIDSLFKNVSGTDEGVFRELLLDFHRSSGKKPDHIIIFRDGVSESQLNLVLEIELGQIIEACKLLDDKWNPKFMVVTAQRRHHTRFFQANCVSQTLPPGTVVDKDICHPNLEDFYMCAHAGMIGTTRPTHYTVLHNSIGFSTYDVQELVHCLSYVNQRSTAAISVVAPIRYAHLAAAKMSQIMKMDDLADLSSSHNEQIMKMDDLADRSSSHNGAQVPSIPELPRLLDKISHTMFFC